MTACDARTVSFVHPCLTYRPDAVEQLLRVVRNSPYSRLWFGASLETDYAQELALLAGRGVTAPTGTSVDLSIARHPQVAAIRAVTTSRITGQPVIAGYGPGPAVAQRGMRGQAYERPLTAMREYLTIVRRTLAASGDGFTGRYFSAGRGARDVAGHRVEIGAGVLRARMAELAGELADHALTWLTPIDYLRAEIVPALGRGSERAGRAPDSVRLVTMIGAAIDRAGRDPLQLAMPAGGVHSCYPHYVDTLNRAGVPVRQDAAVERNITTLLEHGVLHYGDAASVADAVRAHWDAGVAEVVVNLNGVYTCHGMAGFANDLLDIARALDTHARAA